MRYLLNFVFLFASTVGFGQISIPKKETPAVTVGKVAPLGGLVAELSYFTSDDTKDTTYVLLFRNIKYKHTADVKSVGFSGTGNTLTELYKVFKSVFSDENKKNKDYLVSFTLGKSDVSISNTKSMGITSAMFMHDGAYFTLTEKQVDKLFGKN